MRDEQIQIEEDADGESVSEAKARAAKARAKSLSPSARRDIARAAANARWHGDVPKATHEGKIKISDFALKCAVLEDGRRVLSESGVLRAFGLQPGGAQYKRGVIEEGAADGHPVRLPMFLASVNLRRFIDNELLNMLTQPIMYRPSRHGSARPARGLDALLIPKVCEVWLAARDAGELRSTQLATAARADVLMRGLARTGIIALVDEATGYQEVRDRLALQAILDAYLRQEFAAWAKRFPDEYFQEIFRLHDWEWDELRKKSGRGQGPRVIGKYTNDIVYSRLAPGILDELQRINPPNDTGRRKAKHHQFFTEDVGHPALAQHVSNVITLLKASETWEDFLRLLNRAIPRKTHIKDLPLFSQKEVPSAI